MTSNAFWRPGSRRAPAAEAEQKGEPGANRVDKRSEPVSRDPGLRALATGVIPDFALPGTRRTVLFETVNSKSRSECPLAMGIGADKALRRDPTVVPDEMF